MSPCQVRARRDADIPALMAVLRQVHELDGYPVHWHPPPWLTPTGQVAAWTGLTGGVVAGHIALTTAPTTARTAAEPGRPQVSRLFVAPAARGSGLAGALLDAAAAEAVARWPGGGLTLEVHARAAAAIAFYERRGWVRTGTHLATWTEADGFPARAHTYRAPA